MEEEDLRKKETETEEEGSVTQEMLPESPHDKPGEQVMEESSAAVRADEHPLLAPYFKMLRVGVPEQGPNSTRSRA